MKESLVRRSSRILLVASLIFVLFGLINPVVVHAFWRSSLTYDFDLVYLKERGYEVFYLPPRFEIRDGKLEYDAYLTDHPLWDMEISWRGIYFPRDNVVRGELSIKYYNKTGFWFFHRWGDFYTSPIEGESIIIYFINQKGEVLDPGYRDYGVIEDYGNYELEPFKVVWLNRPQIEEPQYEDSGARFSGISGEVYIWHYDEYRGDAQAAKLDMVIYVEDHVLTGERSSAIISFMDMTTFIMKPETEIIIPSPAAKESLMKLVVGNLLINVKRMIEGKTLDVEMGQAVSGTKGTIYVAEERNGISRLKVIEGEVEFRSKATGETQIIKAGEQIYADKSGLGPKTTFDIQEELKSWEPYEKMAQQASQAEATQPSSQEVISSANQIIQIALPMIQSYLPLIVIIMLILIFAATIARRSKRK